MPRNIVIGKLKYLIGPASGTAATLFVVVGFIFVATYGCRVVDSVVGEGVPDPRTEKKGEKLRG